MLNLYKSVSGYRSYSIGLFMVMIAISGILPFTAFSQQVKIESGAYFINNGGNVVVNARIVNSGTITNSTAAKINLSGDFQNDGTFTPAGSTVTMLGSSAQTISGTNPTTFENLTISNSNGVSLSRNITVTGILTLTNGKITTAANSLILGSSATVSGAGAGKYIYGNLQWTLTGTGSPSKIFYVGDATNYAPIQVDFSSMTTGGTITGSTTAGSHPNGLTSGISGGKLVNRYWTLTNNGTVFTSFDATFTFVSSDILGGANVSNFIVKRWASSVWNSTNIANRSFSSTKITGLTAFGDFLDGEPGDGCVQSLPPGSASATPSTICSGSSAVLTLTGGGGGTYETVQWFTASCGGSLAGTGNNLSVSPSATTTYYGRYSDGSPCSYNTTCQQVTVTVNSKPTAVITPGGPTSFCIGGSVTLTASGGSSYLWSTGATTAAINVTATGNYSVTVTGSNGCTDFTSQAVTVYPATAGGSVSGTTTTCSGSNSTVLTLTGNTGNVLKWQSSVNGTSWTDIANTTTTLTAVNLTQTTYYRAQVQSGTCSSAWSGTALITVAATGDWLGVISTDWNTASNWCGGVPTSTSDVVIPGSAPNMPVIGSEDGICRNITINAGASLTITGTNSITVHGNWSGTGTFIANSSTVSYAGSGSQNIAALSYYNLNLSNSGTKTFASGTTNISKDFTVSDNAIGEASTNSTTIAYNGNGPQVVGPISYYNLTLGNAGVKSFSTGTASIAGTFTISGTATTSTGAYNCTINYNGSGAQIVRAITYNNIGFNNSGTKSLPSSTLAITGNWTNNSTVTSGTSTISFNGTSAQTIGGSSSTTFNNITVNNPNGVILSATQTINGTLTFTTGKISLGSNDLLFGTSATISGSNSAMYVVTNGTGSLRLRVPTNTNVSFPIGLSSEYLPLTIKLTANSTADDFKARVTDGLSTAYNSSDVAIGNAITTNAVLKTWSLKEGNTGGSNATVTVQWNAADEGLNFNRSLCDVAHYIGGVWLYSSFSSASGANPYTQSITGITSFSPFGVFGGQAITCSVSSPAFCAGSNAEVTYSATGGTWNAGNVFTAQLSDITGSFSSPVAIGSLTSQYSGLIDVTIPSNTATGTGYRIRVVSNNPTGAGDDNGSDLTVDPPSAGGTVSSDQSICSGSYPADLVLADNIGNVVKWQKSTDAAFTDAVDIDETTTLLEGSAIGIIEAPTYFRAIVQSGTCQEDYSSSVLISISGIPGQWLGTTSADWNDASNWCGGVPSSLTDVIIPSDVPNMPVVGPDGGVCRDLTISSGASLTVESEAILAIAGTFSNSGLLSLAGGSEYMNTWVIIGGSVTNNPGATITSTDPYTRIMMNSGTQQIFTNNGTISSMAANFDVSNSSEEGLTLTGSGNFPFARISLLYGLVINSDKIIMGNGGTSGVVIQRGTPDAVYPAGSFDVSPVFNYGSGGLDLIYENGSVEYSTGFEIPQASHTASSVTISDAADVTMASDLVVTKELKFTSVAGTPVLRLAANTLTINGKINYATPCEIFGGDNSILIINGETSLRSITDGLKELTINARTNLTADLTVNGSLNLENGLFINGGYLTLGDGCTITRSGGRLTSAPSFSGRVNLVYSGNTSITTGYEMPADPDVLMNLTTNPGGVIQGGIPGSPVNLLTDTFDDLNNWSGNIGNYYNQFSQVSSSNAGGMPGELQYLYGIFSQTNYTSYIYRSINTAGYSSLNIHWDQLIDNYDATTDPYTVKVQCATSSSGPWTDMYSLAMTGTENVGPETGHVFDWTTNVGGTFYLRFFITGYTYGIDFWYIDNLVIDGKGPGTSSIATVNGTLDLNPGSFSIGSNTLVLNDNVSGSHAVIGGLTSNMEIGGTSSSLTIPAITNGLNNFTINRPAGVTSVNDLVVNGVLNLQSSNPTAKQGTLEMGIHTLTMGASAITTGTGDVTGIIKRTSIAANVLYSFGNQFTTVKLENGGTLPSELRVKIAIGDAPSWNPGAIQRIYEFVQAGGSNVMASVSSHYLDSELNGNAENELVYWTASMAGSDIIEWGRSNNDIGENWVALQNVNIDYWPSGFGIYTVTLGASDHPVLTWNGSVSDRWNTLENWTPVGSPSNVTNVIIPDALSTSHDPTLPALAEVRNISIENGGIVNASADCQFNVYGSEGAWINQEGVYNANTSHVSFKTANATISGTTSFYDLSIDPDASLDLEYNAYLAIAGSLVNKGIFRADNEDATIEYNGTDQEVVNPNGTPAGYHHLLFSGSGVKSLPEDPLRIHMNFTIAGTASVTAVNRMSIGGNVTIEAGASFNASDSAHTIDGNFTNNGEFDASAGRITFNGNTLQTIGGSTPSTFNDLLLNNPEGIMLANNQTVKQSLVFTNGKIFTGSSILTLSSDVTVTGAGQARYIIGNLAWNIPTGDQRRTFPVGDLLYFTPVSIGFSNVQTSGTLLAKTTGTDHPEIAVSGINAYRSINRYWTLTNSGIGFTTYDATFTFVPEDIDGGTSTSNVFIKVWDGASWSPASMGVRTSTTTQITGMTSFGDFQNGELCIHSTDPDAAGATELVICNGGSTNLSLVGGGGGSNEIIAWYKDGCGTSLVGVGNGLAVTPGTTTTYYGRYEDGSSCAFQSACKSVTITVEQASFNPVSVTAGSETICSGQGTVLTLNGGGGGYS